MNLIYFLMLLKIPKVGIMTFYKALQHFKEPKEIFNCTKKQLKESSIFQESSINFILTANEKIVKADIDWQQNNDCHIITFFDKNYPNKLKEISDPPPFLYIRGNLSLINKPQLAIVGSRNPTSGGSDNAYNFSKNLANDIIITSGMAIGIDTKAHLGALESGNPTIAVCGTGLDRVYPAKNKNLAQQIAKQGALISELPIGTQPLAQNFPKRNRIITGMSDGLLIVEANIKSGSMISAYSAMNQNREVFAIPGSIKNPLSSGPNHLIKDGASLVDNPNDIRNTLSLKNIFLKNTKEVTKHRSVLLKYLDYDGVSFDELVLKSSLTVNEVTTELLQLEINNIVQKTNNNTYILNF